MSGSFLEDIYFVPLLIASVPCCVGRVLGNRLDSIGGCEGRVIGFGIGGYECCEFGFEQWI